MTQKEPRIDVVVDRDPDGPNNVTVYVAGELYSGAHVHHIDPGAGGADDEWFATVTAHADDVPVRVRQSIDETASDYR
ncbi:hypothetical protein [Streptomyces hydrogenans]|uniref:Uncharacterized protein n=1 Tax=Streptomyces hydrogenans TaxID=1873719 RepID=A0ABQ3PJM1_9ACTN|nr:hypothetical protein [Streptomyces hydrogenans]GHG09932.1 hypothetical protein GCM10018784_23230 [Streptomyces hydrogenans]GHI25225.1 hypothetical protein Shyd_65960 [Streptomyces hydrogenans]